MVMRQNEQTYLSINLNRAILEEKLDCLHSVAVSVGSLRLKDALMRNDWGHLS